MRSFLLSVLFSSLNGFLLAFSVVTVTPGQNSSMAMVDTEVTIEFDEPVNIETVNEMTVSVFGRWSGVAALSFQFSADHTLLTIDSTEDFFFGEFVMVGLSRGLSSSEGIPLSHGFSFGFWTKPVNGSMNVVDIGHLDVREEGEGLIQCYGAYAGDLNHDGWCDLTVVNETSEDLRVFLSDEGNYSSFSVHDLPLGNKPSSNEGTDFNGDGEIDLVIGNTQGDMVSVVLGAGDGAFLDEVIYDADQGVRGVTVMDLEGDGDMDIASANRQGNNLSLFINDGNGTFTAGPTIGTPLNAETAIVSADMNEDGIPDLVVGAYIGDEIAVLINDGEGNFTLNSQVATADGPWMISMGDVNGDSHIDIVAACSAANAISIHLGDGMGGLSEAELLPTGGFPLAIDLGDLDGDGDLDVLSSNYNGGNFSLYENLGAGEFGNPQTLLAEIAGSCAIFHDRNHDGLMDITGIDELADVLIFFEQMPLSAEENMKPAFSIYPNPNDGVFELINATDNPLWIELIDVSGHRIAHELIQVNENPFLWNHKEEVTPGVYFLKEKSSSQSIKLIIE